MFVKHEFKKQSCTNANIVKMVIFVFLIFGRIFPSNHNAQLELQKQPKIFAEKLSISIISCTRLKVKNGYLFYFNFFMHIVLFKSEIKIDLDDALCRKWNK